MRTSLAVVMLVPLVACGAVHDAAPDAALGDSGARMPAACTDLGAGAADQTVQLHLDGAAGQPYQAHCSADLKTYLPLDGTNTSSYPVAGCATLPTTATAGVVTTWQMVHFDPATHLVDTGDYTYATSSGTTHEASDNGNFQHDYQTIPFGSGRSCASGTAATVASIDLTGTHFGIASAQAWAANGFTATAAPTINPQRTKATISATGFPVGASPCAANTDYGTLTSGSCLKLDYVP